MCKIVNASNLMIRGRILFTVYTAARKSSYMFFISNTCFILIYMSVYKTYSVSVVGYKIFHLHVYFI